MQVEVLPAHHAVGGDRELVDEREPRLGVRHASLRNHAEGKRQQAVTDENRDVLTEGHVRGRHAAAQRIVVEGWQVVMDERERVDKFERARRGQPCRKIAVKRFDGGEQQHRTQALAARADRVAERLAEALQLAALGDQRVDRSTQRALDERP